METAPQMCHARVECLDALKANVSHHYGFAIIKRTVKKAKMNFSHVHRLIVKMDNLVVANTFSINHIVYHLIINVTW
jgi:hypothetical protein